MIIILALLCSSCENIEDKAMKGDLTAQLRLAHCYETGDSIGITDIEKAKLYYELAGNQGDLNSQKWLIKYYASKNDQKNQFKWYEISAKQGYRDSQHMLGDYYRWGWAGLTPDTLKAIDWYEKAANQNDTIALFRMGEVMIEKNYSKGLEIITKAAELKHSGACFFLGNLYSEKNDYKKAISWYEKQAEAGDPWGYSLIANLLLKKEKQPTRQTIIDALNYYEIAYVFFKSSGRSEMIAMANLVADMYDLLNKQSNNDFLLELAEWRMKGNDYMAAGDVYVKAKEWLKAYECYVHGNETERVNKLYQTCAVKLRKYKKSRDEWFGHETYELPNFAHLYTTNMISFGTGKNERISGAREIYLELRITVTDYQICSCPEFHYTNRDGLYTSFTIDIEMNSVKSGTECGWLRNISYEYVINKLKIEEIAKFKEYLAGNNQKIKINDGQEDIIRELRVEEVNNLRKMMEAYEMLIIVLNK